MKLRTPTFLAALALLCTVAMAADRRDEVERYLKSRTLPLTAPADLDPLLERIGDARIVLLGESSHGTSEY